MRVHRSSFPAMVASVLLLVFAAQPGVASGAEHFVTSATSTVDCTSFGGGVKPGDSIILEQGQRGPLTIRECVGTDSSRITIRNDVSGGGPTIISRSSARDGSFLFHCQTCINVTIDGTGGWASMPTGAYCGAPNGRNGCGIKITTDARDDAPSTFLHIGGFSSKINVRGIEVDGRYPALNPGAGIGIGVNDHSVIGSQNSGVWRENSRIERNYIHNTQRSGLYLGPNWPQDGLRLRNFEVAYNLVEDAGFDGIKLKSAIAGTNRVHHNVVRRVGLYPSGAENGNTSMGIFIYESRAEVYSNMVEDTSGPGPAACFSHFLHYLPVSFGPQSSLFHNNIAINCKGAGISVGRNSSANALPVASIRNNSVYGAGSAGITLGLAGASAACSVADNISVDNGGADIAGTEACTGAVRNNRTGAAGDVGFVNHRERDLRLKSGSIAIDKCTASGHPSSDFAGTKRPQGSACDQGAYEYFAPGANAEEDAKPRPPGTILLQRY